MLLMLILWWYLHPISLGCHLTVQIGFHITKEPTATVEQLSAPHNQIWVFRSHNSCHQSNSKCTITNKYIVPADFLLSVIDYQWLYIRLLNYFVRSTFDGMIRKMKSWQSPRMPDLSCQCSQPMSYDNRCPCSCPSSYPSVPVPIPVPPAVHTAPVILAMADSLQASQYQQLLLFSWNSHRIWPSFMTLAGFCSESFEWW